jgi:hypothetical protein
MDIDHPLRTGLRKLCLRRPGQGVFLEDAEISAILQDAVDGALEVALSSEVMRKAENIVANIGKAPKN